MTDPRIAQKMGFEPWTNHVERKFGNQPVTLEFTRQPQRIKFRSKLEARYANLLERQRELGQILGWWYEPRKMEFPEETSPTEWTVDFLVLTVEWTLEIHECKGMVFEKDAEKFRRAKAHGPRIDKMVMIFAQERNDKPRVKAAISRWAEIRYANPVFKAMFGNVKAGVA